MENLLIKRGQLTPHKIGLTFGDQQWTYQEMLVEAQTILNQLMARLGNIPKRVAVLGSNHADLYFTLLGTLLGNCETVILNNRLTTKEIEEQLAIAKPTVYIYDDTLERQLVVPSQTVVIPMSALISSEKGLLENVVLPTDVEAQDVQTIMFTSGTTGVPKGVQQTVQNHLASAMGSGINLGMTPNDCWLLVVPLYHISGYSMLMKGLIYGNQVVLVDKFQPEKVSQVLQKHQVTHVSLVPTMLTRLMSTPHFMTVGQKLKAILLGGAPVNEEILLRCHEQQLPIIQSFGMTETASQVVALNHQDSLKKIGSSGQPLLPVSLKIDQATAPMVIGEILIAGPNVTPGYINSEIDLTEDGFFKTGDLGYLDEDGFLYVVGRQKELIISGGENIYPGEIEAVLMEHTAIVDVAVTSEGDPIWGECVVAYIQGDVQTPQEELTSLLTQLARYKHPKKYYLIEEIPKNALGKVQKQRLREASILKVWTMT